MRFSLTEPNAAAVLLDGLRNALHPSGFAFQRDQVEMLTGSQEARFTWIAVNAQFNTLATDSSGKRPVSVQYRSISFIYCCPVKRQVKWSEVGSTGLPMRCWKLCNGRKRWREEKHGNIGLILMWDLSFDWPLRRRDGGRAGPGRRVDANGDGAGRRRRHVERRCAGAASLRPQPHGVRPEQSLLRHPPSGAPLPRPAHSRTAPRNFAFFFSSVLVALLSKTGGPIA